MALELKTGEDVDQVTDAELVQDGDKETVYSVRHLTTEKHREIVKQNTKLIPNKRTHQRDEVVDWTLVSDDLLDYVLADWSGVVAKGEPLPCTRAHKLLLDALRKDAILAKAGTNEIAAAPERRAESFRAPATDR